MNLIRLDTGLPLIDTPLSASEIDEAFRHPDATQLYPLLKALRDHGDLDKIEALGSRFAGASPTQQVAILDWREALDTPQRDAFEKGRARGDSLHGGPTDHLPGQMDRVSRLKGERCLRIHEEAFREIQAQPSRELQTGLLLEWVGSLWLMGSGAQAADVSDLFLKAWEHLLGLHHGVLSRSDFVLLVDSLVMMRPDCREEGWSALWQYARALNEPERQQHALQTLQAFSGDQVQYALRTEPLLQGSEGFNG